MFLCKDTNFFDYFISCCKQFTNLCCKEINFKYCFPRSLVISFIKSILEHMILSLFRKIYWHTNMLLCSIWKCHKNNLWLQDTLDKFLTDKTVGTGDTVVDFNIKTLIFRYLDYISPSPFVLGICVQWPNMQICFFEHTLIPLLFWNNRMCELKLCLSVLLCFNISFLSYWTSYIN